VLDSITLNGNEALVVYREDRLTPSDTRTMADESLLIDKKKPKAATPSTSSSLPTTAVATTTSTPVVPSSVEIKQVTDIKSGRVSESGTLVTRSVIGERRPLFFPTNLVIHVCGCQ
jgi:hypothetical protein